MDDHGLPSSRPATGAAPPADPGPTVRAASLPPWVGPEFLPALYQQAVIGSLMAGLAHEFMNPLGFVQANLGAMKRYAGMIAGFLGDLDRQGRAGPVDASALQALKDAHHIDFVLEDVVDVVSQSQEGTRRIRNLLVALRSFVTPSPEPVSEVDLEAVIDSVMGLAWNRVKYKAKVRREIADPLPRVSGRPGQIAQALLSLLLNAVEAIETHGTIVIRAESSPPGVLLHLTDDGCGVVPAHRDRLFDPYFSAWRSGPRLGLGLTLARRIARQHGGDVTVQSAPGRGSTFTLRLPGAAPQERDA